MEDILRILMIENHTGGANLIEEMLVEAEKSGRLPGLQILFEPAADFSQGLARLERGGIDSILAGFSSPDDLSMLAELRQRYPALPVVACVRPDDESLALLAISQGATDYLLEKGGDPRTTAQVMYHVKNFVDLNASQKRLNWVEENSMRSCVASDARFSHSRNYPLHLSHDRLFRRGGDREGSGRVDCPRTPGLGARGFPEDAAFFGPHRRHDPVSDA